MRCLAFLFFILSASANIFAAAGGPDPTFGSGGRVFATVLNMDPARGVALQADGKIIIVGTTVGPDSTQDFAVIRLNADGTTDTGFGTNGLVRIAFDNFANEMAVAAAVQADGKIIVAGSVQLGAQGWDFGVVRLDQTGAVDTSFSGGKVKVNFDGDDFVNDMILQPDGKVLLTGTKQSTTHTDVPLVRLTTTGALDTTLNGTGKVFVGIGSVNNDVGNSLALQSDGKILVAGSTRDTSRGDFLVVRFNTNGVPDGTFGFFGFVRASIGSQFDAATGIAVQTDGKIVVGGTTNSGSTDQPAFVRYSTTGVLDPTFDGDGKVILNPTPGNSVLFRSVLIQTDGKIIGVGTGNGSYLLVRLSANGALDPSFGIGGKVLQSVAPTHSDAVRAVLQPDGKVVAVGGGDNNSAYGFTAARFLTVGAPLRFAFDFDGDGKTDAAVYRPSAGDWYLLRSTAGFGAFHFGAPSDVMVPADYTGDGKTDMAVFRPSEGIWYVLRSENSTFYGAGFGTAGDVPAPGDFDGDGKADLAVYRPGAQAYWYLQQSTAGFAVVPFGTTGDVPAAGDFDGDGKTDVSVYRPSLGQWFRFNSHDGSFYGVQFGTAGDIIVPADYTGDGKTDCAVFRPSTSIWYILRSEQPTFYGAAFGAAGDLPSPGDYDGDGKADLAVWRPGVQSIFYIQGSNSGFSAIPWGIAGDRPVPNAYVY